MLIFTFTSNKENKTSSFGFRLKNLLCHGSKNFRKMESKYKKLRNDNELYEYHLRKNDISNIFNRNLLKVNNQKD
jgi:hypothetical protein